MNFFQPASIEILLGIFTFFITSYLGAMVYLKNRDSATSFLFLGLSLLIDAYIVVNYLSLHPPYPTPESQLLWIRVVMFVTSFIGPALLILVHTFPRNRITLARRYLVPILTLMVVSAVASLTTLVFRSIDYSSGEPVPVPGPAIPIFFLDFVGLFLLSFAILIYKYRRSVGKEKVQILYFLLGVIVTFSFMAISTVISVVVLRTSAAVFLGPLSSVVLMSFIAYAIFRYHLFDIKIISTEGLVAILTIVLVCEGVFSGSVTSIIFKSFFALLVGALGILLVRSVKEEIRQREELLTLTHSLERANIRLQELDRQKTEFLSIASHQLRTPLSIINGYIELIKDGGYGKVGKQVKDVLANMDESNGRLVKLVDEFLNVTRIEQGRTKFIFKPTDASKLIGSVVQELSDRAEQKGLKLVWVPPRQPVVVGLDEEKIRNVIFNFIDNAIKYSETGEIFILLQRQENEIIVRVKDRGLGFGKQDEYNFFQKFYRGENVKGINVTGTGLGLYVCRMFIEAHKGRVWAKSPGVHKGSEFGFSLPMRRSNDSSALPAHS